MRDHGTPPAEETWTVGQTLRFAASVLLALAKVIEKFSPAQLVKAAYDKTELFGECLQAALADFLDRTGPKLLAPYVKLFSGRCQVTKDGDPLPPNWDPIDYFRERNFYSPHADTGETYMPGKAFLLRVKERSTSYRELDQHHLEWINEHWRDPRVSARFWEGLEEGRICLVATGTLIRDGAGHLCALYIHCQKGQPYRGALRVDVPWPDVNYAFVPD